MSSDYLNKSAINKLNFCSVGKCSNLELGKFYNCELIKIGDNVRIDANTVITASKSEIEFGSFIHIGVNCYINGSFGLELHDFTALSAGTNLFTSSDDYSGSHMTNPTVPSELTNPLNGKVIINRYVNIGSNTVIMPNLSIGEGSVVGALSFVNKSIKPWGIYFGSPVRRSEKGKKLLSSYQKGFLMKNKKKFEVGIFALNSSSGIAMTRVKERWKADWEEIENVARICDKEGLDFIIAVQRWLGFGGKTDPAGLTYDSSTFCAALASITKNIKLYCTLHVPIVHPTFAARSLATIDHVSKGRAH